MAGEPIKPPKPNFRKGLAIALGQKSLTVIITLTTVELPKYDGWMAIMFIALLWVASIMITIIDERAIARSIAHALVTPPPSGASNDPK